MFETLLIFLLIKSKIIIPLLNENSEVIQKINAKKIMNNQGMDQRNLTASKENLEKLIDIERFFKKKKLLDFLQKKNINNQEKITIVECNQFLLDKCSHPYKPNLCAGLENEIAEFL